MTPPTPSTVTAHFTPKLFTLLKGGYSLADLRADTLAGLTVAIIALPLALALGIASGATPDKGLVTAIIAGFLISALGGSRVQIGGPTGAFVVVVAGVIAAHGYDGLILATLMAGAILIIAGYARLGRAIRFVPHAVVTGFTTGIAVIIASTQVGNFLGLDTGALPAEFIEEWRVYFRFLATADLSSITIGVGALGVIIVLRRYAPKLPSFLIAIVLASALAYFLHAPVETVGMRFPYIPSGLPAPELPDFSLQKMREVLPAALTIAFLAGIEALLSAVVADGMTGFRHRSDQELIGQGAANIGSALFGGLPATGAIARTAANIRAGARTPVAGMMHAAFLFLFTLVAVDLMKLVPMAALAAVLFMVAWGMSEAKVFARILKTRGDDRVVMMLTFALTVFSDLTTGIAVGVGLSMLLSAARSRRRVPPPLKRD